jgi:peptidoglycan/LPS O-acetylase OafA/YrhL
MEKRPLLNAGTIALASVTSVKAGDAPDLSSFGEPVKTCIRSDMTALGKLGFVPRLESLRGIAAVSVVAYHAFGHFLDTNVTGMAPVVMFFVLSGFVLARSLENDPNSTKFFRHRIFRLVPAATAVVLLLTFLFLQFGFYIGGTQFDPVNVLLNALMIRHDINGVMWSMTVECLATPLILWSFWTFKRWRAIPLRIVISVLFCLSFVGSYVHLLGGFANLAPLYAFVVGVLVHFQGRLFVDKLTPAICRALALVAVIIFCWCGLRKQTSIFIALECFSSALLVALIAFRDSTGLFRILDTPIVRFYGRISYSFYLLHVIGVVVALRIAGTTSLYTTMVLSGIAAVAITTPMAWLSWCLVEKPFIALGRRFDTAPVQPQADGCIVS